MSFSHNITVGWSKAGEVGLAFTATATADMEKNISKSDVPLTSGAVTDYEFTETWDVSEMQSLYLYCDHDATVEANDASSPAFTIALEAGVPRVWVAGMGTNPFSADVTKLFLTITGSALTVADFQVRSLVNR